jgi:nucleotide-binding universal stress UspA family protein
MSDAASGPILSAHDGSPDARAALGSAAELLPGRAAVVLTVPQSKAEINVWSTILDEADRLDAAVVVVGARGPSPVKAALLGSVSRAVGTHSDRPVLLAHG